MKAALLLVALFSIDSLVFAEEEFRFAGIFTDHVVLQRDQDVPVWGFARAGAKVEVTFEDQVAKAIADENGRWAGGVEIFAGERGGAIAPSYVGRVVDRVG